MTRVVATQRYCLENSVHLTRPGFETFLSTDDSNGPTVIDKHQVKRLYRLQRTPYVNTCLHLEKTDFGDETQGNFENVLRKQIDNSFLQLPKKVYHRSIDVSNAALTKFSCGSTRHDPQQIIPSTMTTVRNHPAAITMLRHEKDSNNEIVPRYSDRLVSYTAIRSRLGPGGILNHGEDCREAEDYLQKLKERSSRSNVTCNPKEQEQQQAKKEFANQVLYTSVQQAAFAEVPWDSKLPSKLPAPLTTYEANGSDPLLKSKSSSSIFDMRTCKTLEWDRIQTRNTLYNQKPFNNVAPLTRAQQISGYTGSFGGDNLQDIDNPDIDFKPYTVVRTEQPKFSINPFKTNVPCYTGKSHWTKLDSVSHYDKTGRAYTTTAAFHKSLPIDNSLYRHIGLHGGLSQVVTTVIPQNPHNQMDISCTTINLSIDSRPHVLIRHLSNRSLPSVKGGITKEERIVNNEVNK